MSTHQHTSNPTNDKDRAMTDQHNDTPTPLDRDAATDRLLEVEALALEDVKLADEEAAIAERRAAIKARLLTLLPHGTHQAGPYKVQVKAGPRRLNATRLAEAYPVVQHPELYRPTIDTAAVKHHLAPAELDGFFDQGNPQVVIS